MGRPPLEIKQQQLTIALPPHTRVLLEGYAKTGNRSVAEEIRQRLDKTFASDTFDPVTAELIEGLRHIADRLCQDFGVEWHDDPRAHEAFKVAVAQRIGEYAPPPSAPSAAASDLGLVRSTDPPETIGRMRERDERHAHDYPQLKMAQKTRSRPARWARHIKA